MGGGGGFPFTLTYPCAKRLHCYQIPSIVFAVIMFEAAVLNMAVFGLATLDSLTALSLDIYLGLDLIPPPI